MLKRVVLFGYIYLMCLLTLKTLHINSRDFKLTSEKFKKYNSQYYHLRPQPIQFHLY